MTTARPLGQRVADEVRAEAARQGMRGQSELARKAGLTHPTVRRYFWSGERATTLHALEQVSRALGVPASELVRRAEASEANPAGHAEESQ